MDTCYVWMMMLDVERLQCIMLMADNQEADYVRDFVV